MQQGKSEAKIVALAQKTGGKLPEKIANKPRVRPGLEIYWRAFWDCSTDRDIGMAEGPIPWSSIDRWAFRYEFEGEDFERLVYLIKAMDAAYIEERTKQHDKKMKKPISKGSSAEGIPTKGPIRSKGRN